MTKAHETLLAALLLGGLLLLIGAVSHLQTLSQAAEMKVLESKRIEAERRAAEDRKSRIKSAEAQISGLLAAGNAKMLEIVGRAEKKSASILIHYRSTVPQISQAVGTNFQGASNVGSLIWKMANDKVFGTDKTKEYVREAFGAVIRNQDALDTDLALVLTNCGYELSATVSQVQIDTANAVVGSGLKIADVGRSFLFERSLTETITATSTLGTSATSTGVTVLFEAIFIKGTYATLKKLLTKAVAKQAASLSVGATGAAIPGVNIATTAFSVIGTVWTVYDLWQAIDAMKGIGKTIEADMVTHADMVETRKNQNFTNLYKQVEVIFAPR